MPLPVIKCPAWILDKRILREFYENFAGTVPVCGGLAGELAERKGFRIPG